MSYLELKGLIVYKEITQHYQKVNNVKSNILLLAAKNLECC